LFEHDLFRKPLHTFRHHAPGDTPGPIRYQFVDIFWLEEV